MQFKGVGYYLFAILFLMFDVRRFPFVGRRRQDLGFTDW